MALAGPLLYAADPTAYVSTTAQTAISTLDASSGSVSKLANGGINGTSFVVSPDGRTAYVTESVSQPSFSLSVNVIDLTSGKITGTLGPYGRTNLALSPDGSLLYLGVGGGDFSYLEIISTSTLSLLSEAPTSPCQCQIAAAPDGSKVYVGTTLDLEVFDGKTLAPIATIPLGLTTGISISADGGKLYALTPNANVMAVVVDTAANTVIAGIPNQSGQGSLAGTVLSADGQTLYITGNRGLLRVATSTNTVIDLVSSPALSAEAAVSPDGKYLYVNRVIAEQLIDSDSATVPGLLQFDTAAATFANLPIGGPAIAEQIPSSGSPVYVLQGIYAITAEDAVSGTITKTVSTSGTYTLAASSSGNVVAGVTQVSLSGENAAEISVLSTATHTVEGQFTTLLPAAVSSFPFTYPIVLNADGTLAYLAYPATSDLGYHETLVSILALPGGTVQHSFPVYSTYGGPASLAVSPDGSTVFVLLSSSGAGSGVGVCNASISTLTQIACVSLTIPGTRNDVASAMAISADGTRLYVPISASVQSGYPFGAYLIEVDTASMTALELLTLDLPFSKFSVPSAIAYSAATNCVYVAIQSSYLSIGELARVDLDTYTIANTQGVNYLPAGLAITPDGTRLLVTGSPHGTQMFDGTTLAPIGFIAGGQQKAIVIAPQ